MVLSGSKQPRWRRPKCQMAVHKLMGDATVAPPTSFIQSVVLTEQTETLSVVLHETEIFLSACRCVPAANWIIWVWIKERSLWFNLSGVLFWWFKTTQRISQHALCDEDDLIIIRHDGSQQSLDDAVWLMGGFKGWYLNEDAVSWYSTSGCEHEPIPESDPEPQIPKSAWNSEIQFRYSNSLAENSCQCREVWGICCWWRR